MHVFVVLLCHDKGEFNIIVCLCLFFIPQGTVLCDIILLNFLKGAEQYKAKKFEEVKYQVLKMNTQQKLYSII